MKKLDARGLTRSHAFELSEDIPSNSSSATTIGEVVARRFGRREFMKGTLAAAVIGAGTVALAAAARVARAETAVSPFEFEEIAHGVDETHHVAPGYDADILIRWGDPVFADAPPFDPARQSAEAQERQFGYNNDYIGYIGLPFGSDNPSYGLLCVNHEYTNEELMFPGLGRQDRKEVAFSGMTRELVEIEMAAHGASIVEVRRGGDGKWAVVPGSRFARRISARSTEMLISWPAAGHPRLKTGADPSGRRVIGTLNNCAGGMTPWGTYLTAEENFNGYFMGASDGHPEERNYKRYGVPGGWYAWARYHDRFDIDEEPNEANRFGWVVEIDPLDPSSTPIKRTALGRFKHEGAETIVNGDGRVVVYMGDDERFEYLYRFVSASAFDPADRAANFDLLDRGTLSVAKFREDGVVEWLSLVFGSGPLTPENGFESQADVLIEARRASDLLEATPMDRPEDVEPDPRSGKVYVMLTNNTRREPAQVDAAHPRANNEFGHIIELTPPEGDHAADYAAWEILVKCGDPAIAEVGAMWNPATSENGWFASPDNCAVDGRGRLWVTTDQGSAWSKSGTADGVWALATEAEARGTGRMFFRVPVGAEMCGPKFTPDDETLFVAVQHPAADGSKHYQPLGRDSTFEDPMTRWPDFEEGVPPRPSVVVITKRGGGVIGS